MLSIERLREIDPELKDLSDEDIEEVRAILYDLGDLIWDVWLEEQREKWKKGNVEGR